jgi:hypothetical protein
MSSELWELQQEVNKLLGERIDNLVESVKLLTDLVENVNKAIAPKIVCTGKHCACGKVAH